MDELIHSFGEGDRNEYLKGWTDPEGLPAMMEHSAWLSASAGNDLRHWTAQLQHKLPVYTLAWMALHFISMAVSKSAFGEAFRALDARDNVLLHNKIVGALHAVFAFCGGVYWFVLSGEVSSDGPFAFKPLSAHIVTVSVAFLLYDLLFMAMTAQHQDAEQSVKVVLYELILVIGYFTALVYPCVLTSTAGHVLQLTELSTLFLCLTWLASKSQAQFSTLYTVAIAMLVCFVQRLVFCAGLLWHVLDQLLLHLQLWQVRLPKEVDRYTRWYMGYIGLASIALVALNYVWFLQIVNFSKAMVDRVQRGLPPSADYERAYKRA